MRPVQPRPNYPNPEEGLPQGGEVLLPFTVPFAYTSKKLFHRIAPDRQTVMHFFSSVEDFCPRLREDQHDKVEMGL